MDAGTGWAGTGTMLIRLVVSLFHIIVKTGDADKLGVQLAAVVNQVYQITSGYKV